MLVELVQLCSHNEVSAWEAPLCWRVGQSVQSVCIKVYVCSFLSPAWQSRRGYSGLQQSSWAWPRICEGLAAKSKAVSVWCECEGVKGRREWRRKGMRVWRGGWYVYRRWVYVGGERGGGTDWWRWRESKGWRRFVLVLFAASSSGIKTVINMRRQWGTVRSWSPWTGQEVHTVYREQADTAARVVCTVEPLYIRHPESLSNEDISCCPSYVSTQSCAQTASELGTLLNWGGVVEAHAT